MILFLVSLTRFSPGPKNRVKGGVPVPSFILCAVKKQLLCERGKCGSPGNVLAKRMENDGVTLLRRIAPIHAGSHMAHCSLLSKFVSRANN